MLRSFLASFVSLGLVFVCWPSKSDGQASKAVSLQVRSESWVTNSGFDQAGFTSQCAASQVTLTPDAGSDGLLLIEYAETKGSGYSMFGVGTPTAWGTNIAFKLSLLSPTDGKTLLSLATTASTPPRVTAVSILQRHPQYRLACTAIAAILGSRSEAEKLLPWAVQDKQGLQLLEKTAFVPSTQRDRAFLAVAKRDWTTLQQTGNAAAEPLALFIQSYYKDVGFGQHPLYSLSAQELTDLSFGVSALASTSDSDAPKILEGLLRECSRWRRDSMKPLVIPTLTALGKVGNAFSLSVLDEWTGCTSCEKDEKQQSAMKDIAVAAAEASNSIRARLVKK